MLGLGLQVLDLLEDLFTISLSILALVSVIGSTAALSSAVCSFDTEKKEQARSADNSHQAENNFLIFPCTYYMVKSPFPIILAHIFVFSTSLDIYFSLRLTLGCAHCQLVYYSTMVVSVK